MKNTILTEKAKKLDKLEKLIRDMGCQADRDMLRILGPTKEETENHNSTKELIESMWKKNGNDLMNWEEREKKLLYIFQGNINRYENTYRGTKP